MLRLDLFIFIFFARRLNAAPTEGSVYGKMRTLQLFLSVPDDLPTLSPLSVLEEDVFKSISSTCLYEDEYERMTGGELKERIVRPYSFILAKAAVQVSWVRSAGLSKSCNHRQ